MVRAITTVDLDGLRGGKSADKLLKITISIKNRAESIKMDYSTWRGKRVSFEVDSASLNDDVANHYKRIDFGFASTPADGVESESIYPGKTLVDVLIFEPPVANAGYLEIEFPGTNVGQKGDLKLRIKASDIRK